MYGKHLYIGSLQSEVYLHLKKDYEQHKKNDIPIEDAEETVFGDSIKMSVPIMQSVITVYDNQSMPA